MILKECDMKESYVYEVKSGGAIRKRTLSNVQKIFFL